MANGAIRWCRGLPYCIQPLDCSAVFGLVRWLSVGLLEEATSNINTVSRSSRFLVPSLCGLHRGASVILLLSFSPYQKRRAANILRRNSPTTQGEVPWSWFWHILRYLITAAAPAHEMDHSVLTVLYVGCSFAVRVSWDRASHDICSCRHVC